jgi:hypothetical protein
MIFGVFHFENPGLDVIQTDTVNVMTEESQQYIEDLSTRLREFRPTVVLLEFDPASAAVMQERYEQHLAASWWHKILGCTQRSNVTLPLVSAYSSSAGRVTPQF